MLLAHISDLHVFANRKETPLVRDDAAAVARRVVADAASLDPPLDAVVLTGDLTDGGSVDDYRLLQDILAPLRCPIIVVPGNHDRRATLRAAFADRVAFADADFLHYEVRIGGIRILALDTLVEGRVEGRLCPARIAWVAERLAEQHDGPTVVAMHHPPFATGICALDAATLVEGAEELRALISDVRADVCILAGHVHRPAQARWAGRFAAVAGSPAFQIGLDLTGWVEEPGMVEEPYAYFLHRFGARGDVAIHTRYLDLGCR